MLTYLGILLIIVAESVFSEYAPAKSTNWSIFYFSSLFISYIMIIVNELLRVYDRTIRNLLFMCGLFMLLMLGQQLSLINKDYDVYYESVNDNFIDIVRHGMLIIGFLVLTSKYLIKWAKQ